MPSFITKFLYQYELMRGEWGGGVAQRLEKRMRSQISPCISSCRKGGNFENRECRKAHLMSFCNAIKVSNLPELCLFADVSEEKVSIYSMLLNDFEVGRASSVGCSNNVITSTGSPIKIAHLT